MNLQPVYPPTHGEWKVICHGCYRLTRLDECSADIDAEAFTYYCEECTNLERQKEESE